jgi:hypothetical protein
MALLPDISPSSLLTTYRSSCAHHSTLIAYRSQDSTPLEMREYFCAFGDDASDNAILEWENTEPINVVCTHKPSLCDIHISKVTNVIYERQRSSFQVP